MDHARSARSAIFAEIAPVSTDIGTNYRDLTEM